jgi:hypothetical protein
VSRCSLPLWLRLERTQAVWQVSFNLKLTVSQGRYSVVDRQIQVATAADYHSYFKKII